MRPLIEILEDERTLSHKLDSIYKYILRYDDPETFDILNSKRKVIESDLDKTHQELREYVKSLLG